MTAFHTCLNDRHYHGLILALMLLTVLAFSRRVPVDDAYISFRYAHNFVIGQGLVWNPGERLEGYTNFLWTLLVALGMKLSVAPERWTLLMAIPLHLAGLLLVYATARIALKPLDDASRNEGFLKSRAGALMALLWVGTNNSLNAFATSGMETPLIFALYCGIFYLTARSYERGWTPLATLTTGLLLALAILTRLDSGLLVAGVALLVYSHAKASGEAHSRSWLTLGLLILPSLLLVAPWLVWKLHYYGSIFPNALNVKVRGLSNLGYGFFYIYLFLLTHLFFVFAALLAWWGRALSRENPLLKPALWFALIWAAYLILVGGDFMEFRFLTPILPLLAIATVYAMGRLSARRAVFWGLTTALFLGNLNGAFALEKTVYSYGIEKAESLKRHLTAPGEDWIRIGKTLKKIFGGTDVIITVGAAGAIPYYSELPAVDFIGLCDKEIPKIGIRFSAVPGHRIIAPLEYIVNRGVNLVIEPNNFMVTREKFRAWQRQASWSDMYWMYLDVDQPVNGRLIDEATWIAIPIDAEHYLLAWYLKPHPAVDKAIAEYGLSRVRVVRR